MAAPASAALTPPELYVRQQPWNTHEPLGGWIPLTSAPKLDYLAGYQIGYKLEDSGEANNFQRAALQVTRVPDGRPTQPYNTPPYCVGKAGTVGAITEVGSEVQFEGDGAYTVKVSVGPGSGGPSDCLTGPSTSGSFSVVTRVSVTPAGTPFVFRAKPLAGDPFVGVRSADPRGGLAETRCALNATTAPDGGPTGSLVVPDDQDFHAQLEERDFTRPGAWTCAARGVAEGRDDNFDRMWFGTPWSAPLALDVRTDFRRRTGRISTPKRPRFTLRAEFPAAAAGGRVTVTVYRIRGCKKTRGFRLRKAASASGRFGPKNVRLRIRRPRAHAYYLGRVAFAGTRFVRRSVDPNPMLLRVVRHRLQYAQPYELPAC
jgi:hypothetical protein